MRGFVITLFLTFVSVSLSQRPSWNLSLSSVHENDVLLEQLSLVSSSWSKESSLGVANISDDFRLRWHVVWEAKAKSKEEEEQGVGSGRGAVRLFYRPGAVLGEAELVAGDVTLHRGSHPSERSSIWRMQGLYFRSEGSFVGLMQSSSLGVVENVRLELPASNISFASVFSRLSRLGSNLTRSGWHLFDDLPKSIQGSMIDASLDGKLPMCYFVVTGQASNTNDFSEPPWRRSFSEGRGRGNPVVLLELGLMSPNCGLIIKAEAKSIFIKGMTQAANEYAMWILGLHLILAFVLFRQMRRTLFSSLNAVG